MTYSYLIMALDDNKWIEIWGFAKSHIKIAPNHPVVMTMTTSIFTPMATYGDGWYHHSSEIPGPWDPQFLQVGFNLG